MKHSKDIEKFVKLGKPDIKTSKRMDRLTLDSSYKVMDAQIESNSSKLNIFRLIHRNKVAGSIAAAVLIVLTVGLLIVQSNKKDRIDIVKGSDVTQSPAEMLSSMSLIATYRHGGIEAMEKQMDEAIDMLEPLQSKVTVDELFESFSGS
jgi:hypothetical protein